MGAKSGAEYSNNLKLKRRGCFDAYPARETGLSPELKEEYPVFRV